MIRKHLKSMPKCSLTPQVTVKPHSLLHRKQKQQDIAIKKLRA